jgi:hypothetical protein
MTAPSKEFTSRYEDAKRWRDEAKPFIRQIYQFTCPGREREFDRNPTDRTEDDTTVFTSLPEECASDLAGDLVTYYTPPEVKWAEYLVTAAIPTDQAKAVTALVEEREADLQDLLTASNYYDMAPQWAFEAATHGTTAIWCEKSHIMQPIHFEVVPPAQLLITPGHMGYLDRFRETHVLASSLEALFQGYPVDLSDPGLKMKMTKPGLRCKVVWGFWLDWKDPGNPVWRCEITVDAKRVTPPEPLILGPMAGSCPLLVGRFNPQPNKPWGRGPGWRALPDMRVTDKVSETVLAGLDQALTPTLIYSSDGGLDLSNGLEAGNAYPGGRNFTKDQVWEMDRSNNTETGWYTEERQEDKIRRHFYQDGPRQRGDTPPTAAQWLDERRRVQQRLGKPSAPLFSELIAPLIQRVEYLGVRAGKMPEAITHNERAITILPISPLQKAQNQDKVMVARSNLELSFGILQDRTADFIDVISTLQNIVTTSGDEITVIRKEEAPPPDAAPAPPA